MDKAKAIEKLNDIRCHVKETSAEEQALVMAINALKAQQSHEGTTSDMISREAVIDLLKQMRKDGDMVPWEGKNVFARIRKLPSAQPELIEKTAYIRGFEQGRTQGMIDSQGGRNE